MRNILARFRAWARVWLGIDQFPTRDTLAAQTVEIKRFIAAQEVRARTRHEAVLEHFIALNKVASAQRAEFIALFKEINMRLTVICHRANQEDAGRTRPEEILAKLQEINMRLTVAKVDHPAQYQLSVYDWDTVQAIAAHALETSEAPKEEELV